MLYKSIIFCAFAFSIQSLAGQSISSSSCGCQSITVSNCGGLMSVSSVSPIAPSGIAVATDLSLTGELDLSGAVPYLSAVAFEGQFPTSGSAPVAYGCGDTVAITQEVNNPSGNNAALSSGLSAADINSCGCARRS